MYSMELNTGSFQGKSHLWWANCPSSPLLQKPAYGVCTYMYVLYLCLLYFAWADQRHCQCCIRHTAQFTWRCALYSTAHDNSFSLSYTRNKTGKMQSTINQLKHGKECAVRAIMVLGVVSIDLYCAYSTTSVL